MTETSKIRQIIRQVLLEDEDLQIEYGGQYAEESEMIYRDKNVVIMVPKSQMTSKIYGGGTQWCSTTSTGFNPWSKQGLLIRFLFRGGRKIRLTYLFDRKFEGHDYNWAREDGNHTLMGNDNPFDFGDDNTEENQYKDVADRKNDIMNLIGQIPEEGKAKVLQFIENNRKAYNYCYREQEYYSQSVIRKEGELDDIIEKYAVAKAEMEKQSNYRAVVSIRYSKSKNKFELSYTPDYRKTDYQEETFVDSKPAEKKYAEMINRYLNMPSKPVRRKTAPKVAQAVTESYDDVGVDFVKTNLNKLSSYKDFTDKKVIGDITYLHFADKGSDNTWKLWGSIKAFDNSDGTEVGNASYGRWTDSHVLKADVDVRQDKRRMGIASNMYQWIEELTKEQLHPDVPHSDSAAKLWSNPNRKFGLER